MQRVSFDCHACSRKIWHSGIIVSEKRERVIKKVRLIYHQNKDGRKKKDLYFCFAYDISNKHYDYDLPYLEKEILKTYLKTFLQVCSFQFVVFKIDKTTSKNIN